MMNLQPYPGFSADLITFVDADDSILCGGIVFNASTHQGWVGKWSMKKNLDTPVWFKPFTNPVSNIITIPNKNELLILSYNKLYVHSNITGDRLRVLSEDCEGVDGYDVRNNSINTFNNKIISNINVLNGKTNFEIEVSKEFGSICGSNVMKNHKMILATCASMIGGNLRRGSIQEWAIDDIKMTSILYDDLFGRPIHSVSKNQIIYALATKNLLISIDTNTSKVMKNESIKKLDMEPIYLSVESNVCKLDLIKRTDSGSRINSALWNMKENKFSIINRKYPFGNAFTSEGKFTAYFKPKTNNNKIAAYIEEVKTGIIIKKLVLPVGR